MHPELFELKALVAGRLDLHRRREIDDHLGSCADCSRHYVAMMLGSASPKTAEAEAREALVPSGGSVLSLVGGGAATAPAYGIDAPITPSASPRPAAKPVPATPQFEVAPARAAMPVSPSLADAISKIRAETEASAVPAAEVEVVTPAPPAVEAKAALAPEIIAPVAESPLIAPSIFQPTPYDGVSLIHPPAPTPPKAAAQPVPAPELVVTFSSTPPRTVAQRAPVAAAAPAPAPVAAAAPAPAPVAPEVVAAPSAEMALTVASPSPGYVSMAVPTLASMPASAFEITTPTASPVTAPKKSMAGGAIAAAALLTVVALAGYKYFQSSVSKAASEAAAAAAKQVESAARASVPAAAAPVAPQVQTRIVYVEKPSSKKSEPAQTRPETVLVAPAVPIAVTLPDVNLNTGNDAAAQSSTQRSAASELTRSARATAIRTATPRP